MEFEILTKIIRSRQTTYANCFLDKELDKETIEAIVENGLWAPTHKITQPWRFTILAGKHKQDLGVYMAEYYRKILTEKQFSTERYEEVKIYANNATLVALIFKPNKRANLPEWEEMAAISCAIQNMWLSCTALNIGCYWDTGAATIDYVSKEIALNEDERCIGILYMGYINEKIVEKRVRKRKPISNKLNWNYK